MKVKTISVLLLLVLILAACGSVQNIVADKYPVKDTVKSSTNADDAAKIYIAEGQSINDVSNYLKKQKEPKRASQKKDNKEVLVYDDYFVTMTESSQNPDNTEIEVADYAFVRDNYRPSFFEGLFAGYVLSNLFGVNNWAGRQSSRCASSINGCYGGYGQSGGRYKGPSRAPSFRGSMNRGGGIFSGK